ncbi:PAS domain-containing protein [Bacteroidales bacterium OttesenSCG-928-B11]|nr:PAS domain-containing protein [Bacteroidales bacterium OttesenSCG-928-B11]MDL2326691.1 PAS domain-containing protein [Bacteroidales bacterium OttesenSCG-928-A14]
MKYFDEIPFAVTISDKNGNILEMNKTSVETFVKDGKSIIGNSLFDCHPEPAKTKLKNMFENPAMNAYTIEKNGRKKLIYQSPWYENGEFMGYVELSLILPDEMQHFVRK